MRAFLIILVAYFLGSIPFGFLVVQVLSGADVRATGSGGTGATNVSRKLGKLAGVLTLLLDAMKGALAIFFAGWLLGAGTSIEHQPANGSWLIAAAATAVITGHIFPVWLGFRGGKGVATGLGVFLVLAPFAVAVAALIFFVTVGLTRYVSLGSILAVLTIPLFIFLQSRFVSPRLEFKPLITASILAATLIVLAHRGNIQRLLNGNENKFK